MFDIASFVYGFISSTVLLSSIYFYRKKSCKPKSLLSDFSDNSSDEQYIDI